MHASPARACPRGSRGAPDLEAVAQLQHLIDLHQPSRRGCPPDAPQAHIEALLAAAVLGVLLLVLTVPSSAPSEALLREPNAAPRGQTRLRPGRAGHQQLRGRGRRGRPAGEEDDVEFRSSSPPTLPQCCRCCTHRRLCSSQPMCTTRHSGRCPPGSGWTGSPMRGRSTVPPGSRRPR